MRAAVGQYETKGKEVVKMNNTIFYQWGGRSDLLTVKTPKGGDGA